MGLPRRLQQTFDLLMTGLSEKQVAHALGISPFTLHGYVKLLHKRLGVTSRGELLAVEIRRLKAELWIARFGKPPPPEQSALTAREWWARGGRMAPLCQPLN